MLLALLVWFSRYLLAESMCMQLYGMQPCHIKPYDNPDVSVHDIPLKECMEKCFVNLDRPCNYIQWNTVNKQCYMYKQWEYDKEKSKDCVLLSKNTACYVSTEDYCFQKSPSERVSIKSHRLEGLGEESDCRTLCRVGSNCKEYVWNTRTHTCIISQLERGEVKYRKLEENEKSVVKKNPCQEGRCAAMYSSVTDQTRGIQQRAKTIYECLGVVLRSQDLYQLLWDSYRRKCRVYKADISKYSSNDIADKKTNLILLKESKECNLHPGDREICLRRQDNARMENGLKLRTAEEDCPLMCTKILNCAAVDWDSAKQLCFFHFIATHLRDVPGYTNYRVIDCDAGVEETSLLGVMIYSHYRRQETASPTPNPASSIVDMLQCAMSCSRGSCTGFTLTRSTRDREAICQMDALSPSYTRVV